MKEKSLHIKSVDLREDYRCFEIGLKIELKPITLFVGDQGTGKSSMINLIQENSEKVNLELSEYVMKNSIDSFYFDTEKMNPRTADQSDYCNPDGTNKGIGIGNYINSRFMSHGEVLVKLTIDALSKAKNAVILLDEPESSLSIRNQFRLIEEIKKASKRNVQLIISTHCLPLIQSLDEVYSMEELKWIKSDEFIEKQRN